MLDFSIKRFRPNRYNDLRYAEQLLVIGFKFSCMYFGNINDTRRLS